MPNPLLDEQLEIIRRSAERGLHFAHAYPGDTSSLIDIFQHILDEIERAQASLKHDNSTGNWWGWNPHG